MKQFFNSGLKIYIPETIFEKSRGILWHESLLDSGCMLFPKCNWVHSFFLQNPIRLYFLDESFSVVNSLAKFPPNRFSPWIFGACYTLETSLDFDENCLQELLHYFQQTLST